VDYLFKNMKIYILCLLLLGGFFINPCLSEESADLKSSLKEKVLAISENDRFIFDRWS
jgi:hypothetical protein